MSFVHGATTSKLNKSSDSARGFRLTISEPNATYRFIGVYKATKKCKVVETRPTETTWIQVGPAAFKTQVDAEKQIKTVCVEKR